MYEKVLIKYDGQVREIPVNELDMDPETASDTDIRTAVAQHLDAGSLSEFVVERADTIINLRPSASYG